MFLRIPVALFFTIALPLIIVVLFNHLRGADATVETKTGDWSIQQFYVAALAAFEVVSATFTNLANMIPDRRQDGVMKRWRGTPLPPWTYLSGFVGAGLIIAVAGFALIVGIGFAFYNLSIDVAKVPALVVAFILGTLVFSALGVAIAGLIRSQEAAPAVTSAIILPMAFISNTFIAVDYSAMPGWLDFISRILPLRPFVRASGPVQPDGRPSGVPPRQPRHPRRVGRRRPRRCGAHLQVGPDRRRFRVLRAGAGVARRPKGSERRDSSTAVSPTDPPLPPSPDEPTEEPQWHGGEPGEPPPADGSPPTETSAGGRCERALQSRTTSTRCPEPSSRRASCPSPATTWPNRSHRRETDRGLPTDW